LNKLLGHVTIAQGGVLPNIHQSKSTSFSQDTMYTNIVPQTCCQRRPQRARELAAKSYKLFFLVHGVVSKGVS
jgi:histone H2A